METKNEDDDAVESDTDIGSHGDIDEDDDQSFSFDYSEEADATDASGDGASKLEVAGTDNNLVSRVGAKVRRLNLSRGDNDQDGARDSKMDVKKSLARSSFGMEGRSNSNDSNYGSPRNSPAARKQPHSGMKQQHTLFGKSQQSPISHADVSLFNGNGNGSFQAQQQQPNSSPSRNDQSKNNMLICPPSTAKKSRGVSRLFMDDIDSDGDDDASPTKEDVSPRDVGDFPFFPDSPSSNKKKSGKENRSSSVNHYSSSPSSTNNNTHPAPPQCPPSTTKKPNHRRLVDLNNTSRMARSPPKGPRSLGRANSFLQMFSQDSLKGIHEESENEEEHFMMHKPSAGRGRDNESMGEVDFTIPSPKRPMRSHHRFTPASPTATNNKTISNNGPSSDNTFSRFVSDFQVVGTLGTGSFGSVYSVRNRMDKRLYAIKAAKREARGESDRNRMLQEVYALASLSDKACEGEMHIVRYHQAWMEGNRLYIQTELCDTTLLEEMKGGTGVLLDEKRRYKLLREMLLALELVHKSGMIHLDIKPENILLKGDQYKLSDFGLVSDIENHEDVEEGDSRYMSMELLSGDLDDLTKSDIFSLGATMYEICLARPQNLPENGQEWQDIRQGNLLRMPNTPFDMSMIIREMMAPEWRNRPSAEELLKKRQLLSDEQRQLIVERNKANAANTALDAQMQRFKLLSPKNARPKFSRSNTIC